jgi:hypothetical protein
VHHGAGLSWPRGAPSSNGWRLVCEHGGVCRGHVNGCPLSRARTCGQQLCGANAFAPGRPAPPPAARAASRFRARLRWQPRRGPVRLPRQPRSRTYSTKLEPAACTPTCGGIARVAMGRRPRRVAPTQRSTAARSFLSVRRRGTAPHRSQQLEPAARTQPCGGIARITMGRQPRRVAPDQRSTAARAVDAVAERRPRPAPPSVEEWGGGLGDVLPRRAETRAERAPSGRGGASTTRERREPPSRPSFSAADAAEPDYATLMQMHLRDNGPRATRKPADLTRHLKAVRAPPRNAEATCSICLDPLAASSASLSSSQRKAVCSLPCGHFFHRQCITETINHGHTCCPNCRFDLVTCAPAECPA